MPKALPPEHQQRLDESSKRLFARGKKPKAEPAKEETLQAIEAQAKDVPADPDAETAGELEQSRADRQADPDAETVSEAIRRRQNGVPDAKPAPPKPLEVVQARTLVHVDGRQYSFVLLPNGDVSVQQQRRGNLVAVYVMPRPEGDYLWSRLRGQGFERF